MLIVSTYTHKRKTAKFLTWCPDSKKISCALWYLFICLRFTHRHCSGSDHIVLKHTTNSEQGIVKNGHGVVYGGGSGSGSSINNNNNNNKDFSGVFTSKKVDGVGNNEIGYTTMFDIQTLLEAFLKMSLICLFH